MVIREPLGLLTYKRPSQLLFLLEFLMCYDVTLSADKGSLFILGIVNGCRIRIGIPIGNAVGIEYLNISSFIFRIASQGPTFVYHTNFFPLSSSFLHAELKFRSKCKTTSFAFVFLVLNIKFLCETLRSFWIWPQEAYTILCNSQISVMSENAFYYPPCN